MNRINLEYYKTVARTVTDVDILKAEMIDLIGEIESDCIYKAVKELIEDAPYEV